MAAPGSFTCSLGAILISPEEGASFAALKASHDFADDIKQRDQWEAKLVSAQAGIPLPFHKRWPCHDSGRGGGAPSAASEHVFKCVFQSVSLRAKRHFTVFLSPT